MPLSFRLVSQESKHATGSQQHNCESYICEQNEVLEAGVKMSLLLEADNLLKVRMIYVGINTEQALEYCLYYFLEVWRERCALTKGETKSRSGVMLDCSNIMVFIRN
jgi:hypothetical protein